jgi:quercetin dioxygenase-like cupin family protein
MTQAYERPFRPHPLRPNELPVFALQAMARQLMTEESFAHSGRDALTLVHSKELTVVLTVARRGKLVDEHGPPGPAAIIALSGSISVKLTNAATVVRLEAPAATAVTRDADHVVEALEDSAFLIVIGEQ